MMRWRTLLVATSLLLLTACESSAAKTTVLVSAAASLTDAFAEVERAFEAANPQMDVMFNFAGSSSLREQILEGAPADVFASANQANMGEVARAGLVDGEPVVFAINRLLVAIPADNPGGVTGVDDFANDDLLIGLCAEEVPCGSFAREILANAGVVPAIDSNEPDVRALLTKIGLGELDAGIAYATDIASSGDVVGIEIPEEFSVEATYPIAVLAQTEVPDAAGAFVDFVVGEVGQEVLSGFGFVSP